MLSKITHSTLPLFIEMPVSTHFLLDFRVVPTSFHFVSSFYSDFAPLASMYPCFFFQSVDIRVILVLTSQYGFFVVLVIRMILLSHFTCNYIVGKSLANRLVQLYIKHYLGVFLNIKSNMFSGAGI